MSLSSAIPIQSMPFHPTPWRSILVLSFCLCQALPVGLYLWCILFWCLYVPRAPHLLVLLDFTIQIIFGEECRSLSSSLCSFLHSPGTSSVLGPNIFLSTVFLNTPSLCFSLFVKDQLSCPYFLIIIYWIANWKTEISAPNDSKHFLSWIPLISFYWRMDNAAWWLSYVWNWCRQAGGNQWPCGMIFQMSSTGGMLQGAAIPSHSSSMGVIHSVPHPYQSHSRPAYYAHHVRKEKVSSWVCSNFLEDVLPRSSGWH